MRRILLGSAMIGIVLISASYFQTVSMPKAEPPAQLSTEPYTLILSKEVAQPGEQLKQTVEGKNTDQVMRGMDSVLEHWDRRVWTPKFVLLAGSSPSVQPYPLPVNMAIPSIGYRGPGPEVINLPREMAPGWYRIRKTIVEPGVSKSYTLYARLQVKP